MSNAQLYSRFHLVTALRLQFPYIGDPIFMNSAYCAATRAWVEKQFTGYIWNFEIARGQLTYRKRGNQCEHFALRAALEVVDLFRQMPDSAVPPEAESIAIAAVMYLRGAETSEAVWHEVNLWLHDGVWFPWEPQQRRYFEFTPAELKTVHQSLIP